MSGADVPHLTRADVDALMDAARAAYPPTDLRGERDALLIALLYDAALRITEVVGRSAKEAAQLTREVNARRARKPGRPRAIVYEARPGISCASFLQTENGYGLRIIRKGGKIQVVGVSRSLVTRIYRYAMDAGLERDAPLFPFNRSRAAQIMRAAYKASGVVKPPGVGAVHVLRHTGAVALMTQTRNPKAVQDQLGHSDMKMTMRYMKTVQAAESLRVVQERENDW
jgi:integrase